MKFFRINIIGKDKMAMRDDSAPEVYRRLLESPTERSLKPELDRSEHIYERYVESLPPGNFLKTNSGALIWSDAVVTVLNQFNPTGLQVLPCSIVSHATGKTQSTEHNLIYNRNLVNLADLD